MTGQAIDDIDGVRAAGGRTRYLAAAFIALAGELLVAAAALMPGVSMKTPLLLHCVAMICCVAIVLRGHSGSDDKGQAIIALFVVAACGPAGAAAVLGSLTLWRPRIENKKLLEDWYHRLGRAGAPELSQILLDRTVSGRVQRPEAALPIDFIEVLERGTLDERQRALGLIAREFHPDYSPVLQAALRSPEPIVRVQASAVVARVREDLKARIGMLLAKRSDAAPLENITSVGELHALQGCPFVEPLQRLQCRQMMTTFLDASLERGFDAIITAVDADNVDVTAIESFLIDQQRYREFRVLRRVRQLSGHSWFKLRRLSARGAA